MPSEQVAKLADCFSMLGCSCIFKGNRDNSGIQLCCWKLRASPFLSEAMQCQTDERARDVSGKIRMLWLRGRMNTIYGFVAGFNSEPTPRLQKGATSLMILIQYLLKLVANPTAEFWLKEKRRIPDRLVHSLESFY
jgi:hypothetical protein